MSFFDNHKIIDERAALRLHKAREEVFEQERDYDLLERFAREAKEQLKLFEPLRKLRR